MTWNDLLIEILNMTPDDRKTTVYVTQLDSDEQVKIATLAKYDWLPCRSGYTLYPD